MAANRGRRALAAILVAALAGCATYEPAPLDPAASARSFAARRLDSDDVRADIERLSNHAVPAWPPAEWNRADLLAVAIARNPGIAVARAELAAAEARETGAAEIPNPTLGLQSEYARREADHWLYGLSLAFAIRPPGTRRLAIEAARAETRSAREKLMDRIWTTRRDLVAALGEREAARRRLAILKQLGASQDRLVDLQNLRVEAGEDSPADLVAARAARIDIEREAAAAREDVVHSDGALAAALGVPLAALDGIDLEWRDWGDPPPLDDAGLAAAREAALLGRADLAAAIADYDAADTKLKQAIARQYPSIELDPGYYWDHGIAKWPFDVNLALPVFNRNRGEIAAAKADRALAGQRMLALQASIQGDIDAARTAEAVAREHLDASRRRSAAEQRRLDQADLALKLGALDRMERSSTAIVALRAELERIDALARVQSARDALEDAVHAPLSGPELGLAPAPATPTGNTDE